MDTRRKLSAGLIGLGLILAILPLPDKWSLKEKPETLLSEALDEKSWFTVDQVARFVVSEDSSVQLIDLRPQNEFRKANIPGSINIPYNELLNDDPVRLLNQGNIKIIFYSNGDFESNYAFILARGLKYRNTFVMKGGLNEWFKTVMNSSFTGDRISARENALFETRARAGKLFSDINSLPDSLKMKFMEAKHSAAKKLDGGCE